MRTVRFGRNTHFCRELGYVANTRFFRYIFTQIWLRQMWFDSHLTQISGPKNGGWSLLVTPEWVGNIFPSISCSREEYLSANTGLENNKLKMLPEKRLFVFIFAIFAKVATITIIIVILIIIIGIWFYYLHLNLIFEIRKRNPLSIWHGGGIK